ncbi:Uncharacterized protein ImpI/VasC [hydrothermal vent metagenome]|uniref:Uncharacterized protein ImpI/VasC n=1 Tax=hydrothermal vent metagenome TaxID=652676 RepID=A0A3B0YEW2_9ZZZZ
MALTLTITSYQSQTLGADGSKTFTEAGGSIGRAQGNDWVLPDPERYISGRHAAISCQNGTYYLTDTSTNGVFFNGSQTPIGNGNAVPLNSGDRFSFGDYEVAVAAGADAITSPPSGQWDASPATGNSDVLITSPTGRSDMPESLDPLSFTSPPAGGFNSEVTDPFAAPPATPGAEADHVPSLMESFQPPAASSEQIPDNWDMTDYSAVPGGAPTPGSRAGMLPTPASSIPAPAVAQPAAPAAAQAPAAAVPPGAVAAGGDMFAAFLRGAGIDPATVAQTSSAEAMENYGAMFREVVKGLMEVLMARASLKSEFRMPLTTIRPVENNPLKFSPSVDDAMRNLFMSQGGSYLSPTESVREGFEDIKHHQMAMVVGMQEAFRDLLHRLEPESFQGSEQGGVRGALMSVNRKSRAWEAYCEFFKKVTRDADTSFQTLFGEEFARAYEEQIQRLTALQRKP